MPTLAVVLDYLERLAPLRLAASWDNVGLLLGERTAPVRRVMTCLTVTPESAAEAIAAKADLIVTHHPVLFRPVQRLTDANAEGRMLLSLLQAHVAIYSPHTAFDNAAGGINDSLADLLQLQQRRPLRTSSGGQQFKIVVFVPEAAWQQVADALFAAGAGRIGQYRECSFRSPGTGTFFGSEATNPAIGQKGRREEVAEFRLEALCPKSALGATVAALRQAHPYEEPAFDIYPLHVPASGEGEGRVGVLAEPRPLREVAHRLQTALSVPHVQVIGELSRPVARVAIVCGAGGEFLSDAVRAGADMFMTGEMRFHDYLAAQAQRIALVLPGHYATERFALERLALRLQSDWPDLEVWASRHERDPVVWV